MYASACDFWKSSNFYGVSLAALWPTVKPLPLPLPHILFEPPPPFPQACTRHFTRPTVDLFDPATLLAVPCHSHFDFHTLKPEQLHVIELPINCELQVMLTLLPTVPVHDCDIVHHASRAVPPHGAVGVAGGRRHVHWLPPRLLLPRQPHWHRLLVQRPAQPCLTPLHNVMARICERMTHAQV